VLRCEDIELDTIVKFSRVASGNEARRKTVRPLCTDVSHCEKIEQIPQAHERHAPDHAPILNPPTPPRASVFQPQNQSYDRRGVRVGVRVEGPESSGRC
jgi:hypothetical protein